MSVDEGSLHTTERSIVEPTCRSTAPGGLDGVSKAGIVAVWRHQ